MINDDDDDDYNDLDSHKQDINTPIQILVD